MAAAFDDSYYDAAEPEADILAADDALAAAAAWQGEEGERDAHTFAAVHKRVTGCDSDALPDNDYDVPVPAGASEGESDSDAPPDDKGLADTRDEVRGGEREGVGLAGAHAACSRTRPPPQRFALGPYSQ